MGILSTPPWIRRVCFSFVLLFLCGKPLVTTGVGGALRLYAWIKHGYHLDYRALAWNREGIFLYDLSVEDKGSFLLQGERGAFHWKDRSIALDRVHVTLQENIPLFRSGKMGGSFSLEHGTFSGEGIERGSFSLQIDEKGCHADVQWPQGKLSIEGVFEEALSCFSLRLQEVSAQSFSRYVPQGWEGLLTGELLCKRQKGAPFSLEGSLQMEQFSVGSWLKGGSLLLSGKGPLDRDLFLKQGNVRLDVDSGALFLEKTSLTQLKGSLSYWSDVGAKWALQADLLKTPLVWEGRGFGDFTKEGWIQTEMKRGDSSLHAAAIQTETGRRWEMKTTSLSPLFSYVLQDLLGFFSSDVASVSLLEGSVDASIAFHEAQGEIGDLKWNFFEGNRLLIRSEEFLAGCKLIRFSQGEYLLEGGSVSWRLPNQTSWIGSGWSGRGNLETGEGSFQGKIQEADLEISHLVWENQSFQGLLSMGGVGQGRFPFEGSWNPDGLLVGVKEGNFGGMVFSSAIRVDRYFNWSLEIPLFAGPVTPLLGWLPVSMPMEGELVSSTEGFFAQGSLEEWQWHLSGLLKQGRFDLANDVCLEEVSCFFDANREGLSMYDVRGFLGKEKRISLFAPVLQTEGDFDIRWTGDLFDRARLKGRLERGAILFDLETSHLFGSCLTFGQGQMMGNQLEHLEMKVDLSCNEAMAAADLFSLKQSIPIEGTSAWTFRFHRGESALLSGEGIDLSWQKGALPFVFQLRQEKDSWDLVAQGGLFDCKAKLFWEEKKIKEGVFSFKEGFLTHFEGDFLSWDKKEIRFASMWGDFEKLEKLLALFDLSPKQIRGEFTGSGLLSWNPSFEADFDLKTSSLVIEGMQIESKGEIHLSSSSNQILALSGLDLSFKQNEASIDAKIDLLEWDLHASIGRATKAHLHIPKEGSFLLASFLSFSPEISLKEPLRILADLEWKAHSREFSCSIGEGFFPWEGGLERFQKGVFLFSPQRVKGTFDLFYHKQWVPLCVEISPKQSPSGTLQVGPDMKVNWHFEDRLWIDSIEGSFGGIDASFHRNEKTLLGSARIDCNLLAPWVPSTLAEVFERLYMGRGFELMGSLDIGSEGVFFDGILSGKQVELFSYQLKTLLAKISIAPSRVAISDFKISDAAGMLQIDEIVAKGEGDLPWTLSIPRLLISEMRPKLLQKAGGSPGEISPLVIRKLLIEDFFGILNDGNTYRAKGELSFINSYKRESSLFDIPSNVLSRIVGIDLDLLIPVCGNLSYELKHGAFHFKELKEAYSENKRSEFFLIHTADAPMMDLDGNLNLLVKMKHYVLFAFTEAFIISIDGNLIDPGYHLTRNKKLLASSKNCSE